MGKLVELGKNLKCLTCEQVLSLENIEKEKILGLNSKLWFRCENFSCVTQVMTGKVHEGNTKSILFYVNSKAVLGSLHAGVGYTALNKILACLNILLMSDTLFKRYEREVGPAIKKAAKETPELCNDIIKRRRLVIKNATVDSKIDHNFLQSKRSCYTTPRRNVFEPRYISEIRTPDFGSPRRTKRILSFVRDNDMKKSKMIEALREKNRKLQKRICSFEEIVKHFKKKNMVTDGTGDALLV
ncbi:hypothetical protein PV326_008450 [Microctonus aethiopoides]|nr:hypothetical protein PV326_008450 [Microctonus aethiopoides]